MSGEPAAAPGPDPQSSPEDSSPSSCFELVKNCLLCLVGLSLMAWGEWLSFEKEESKRQFFEQRERMEDVQDRLHERLERARASRTPLDFDEIWNSYNEAVEESRKKRAAERAGTAATTSQDR